MSTGFISFSARRSLLRFATAFAIIVSGAMLVAAPADARLGGGSSFGSRGTRTFSMPSATPTAPRAAPIERSQSATPMGGYNNGYGRNPGFFGGGFGRGLLGGFLGAGLFGLLFGSGLTGGLGGGFSLIGLLLQIGLLYLAFRFIMGFFRRQQPAFGTTSMFGGGGPFGGNAGMNAGAPPRTVPITIGPDDYQAFERRLIESQAAYTDGNIAALRQIATPEMSGHFAEELAANDRQGVVNKISDVHLLQGDLSEAWREGAADYATVAMRFSLIDATMERATGRVVAGDLSAPQQVTEVWTFSRPAGAASDAWRLSAIQQT